MLNTDNRQPYQLNPGGQKGPPIDKPIMKSSKKHNTFGAAPLNTAGQLGFSLALQQIHSFPTVS
jgi:hypothetical protein